ncbi:MAG: hypothetical protein ACLFOY_02090 [Desulfatibacillaceae bacterium]
MVGRTLFRTAMVVFLIAALCFGIAVADEKTSREGRADTAGEPVALSTGEHPMIPGATSASPLKNR